MELNYVKDEKDKMKLEIIGEGHTLLNPLVKELWQDSHVKNAGYFVEHALVSHPVLILETEGEMAKVALKKAAVRLGKSLEEIKTKFKSVK